MAEDLPEPVHRPVCCCIGETGAMSWACVCGDVERCLRGWAARYPQPAMTPDQRTWCLEEIKRQGDSTDQGDFSGLDDAALANQVLVAWRDYCRDKGMI